MPKLKTTTPWTDAEKKLLIQLYPEKSNPELCDILHKTDGQLRGMKSKLGLNSKSNPLTIQEKTKIELYYTENKDAIDLDSFAKNLGRPKTSISRYARKLGLTKNDRAQSQKAINKATEGLAKYRQTDEYKYNVKEQQIQLLRYYAQNNHPRGMLGKTHTKEVRKRLSTSHIEYFATLSKEEKHERIMKSVETTRKNGGYNTTCNAYSRCKGGYRNDLQQYFRSAWEANIARILNLLNIQWCYEYKRFNFDAESSGVLSYQPDFYLPQYDKWIEVKGWMDDKSKRRLYLFEKYYPSEYGNLILINEKKYNNIKLAYKEVIDTWE